MITDKLKMDQKLVREWLTEYKSLPGSEMPRFARQISANVDLLKALFHVLNSSSSVYQDSVCSQLYEFYRSGHLELKRFCIQFTPLLIWQYLRSIAMQENIGRVESLLLGIYNLEVVEADGTAKAEVFTIPTLARPSIYHEPMSPLALTDNLLLSHPNDHTALTRGPLPQISTVNAQNRFDVLCHVVSHFNADIGFLSSLALQSMCVAYSRLTRTGFSSGSSRSSSGQSSKTSDLHLNLHNHPRIALTPNFLLELMTGVYFAMFNGHATAATQALEDIHFRASYELFSEVLLVTNAIQNSLESNPSGRPSDGPVGINIAVTPASPAVKRAAITNASFKTRRNKDSTTTTTITVMIEGVEKGDRHVPTNSEKIIVRKTNSDHLVDEQRSRRHGNHEHHHNGTGNGEEFPLVKQRSSRSMEGLELQNMPHSRVTTNGSRADGFSQGVSQSQRTSNLTDNKSVERSRSKEDVHRSAENLRIDGLSIGGKAGMSTPDGLTVTYQGLNGNQSNGSKSGSRNSVSYETTL
ncbi:hyccin-like [Diadema antillarum]|uniref:hyccin-like n=2 Tax=Diadema antillarum TaxID=105358 RepID=UPI003A848FFE